MPMNSLKVTLVAASVAAMLAHPVYAGGMAEPEVVVEEAPAASNQMLIPLLMLLLIGVAVSDGGSKITD